MNYLMGNLEISDKKISEIDEKISKILKASLEEEQQTVRCMEFILNKCIERLNEKQVLL